jgi:spoIIIJ-associated protein
MNPIEAAIKADRVDDRIILTIAGDQSGLLIGRKGKTLDALQYIVNKIVNKSVDKKADIVIDSEDYRKRREDSLTQIARKMGDKAKRTGKAVTTAPLNPHDRRIIHLTVKEDQGLETKSRGEGLMKRVIIIPKHKGR